MPIRRQLTVAWQNRPGELANVCRTLAEAGVNIEALATAEAGEYGAIRLLVDDVEDARAVFQEAGVAHTAIDVLVVVLSDVPGALADVAGRLAEAKVNIEYFYASTSPDADGSLGVFKVSDPATADRVLGDGAGG